MSIFRRRRTPELAADLGSGFWVTEAPAMQHAILGALTRAESARAVVPVELTFDAGAEGRVVALWRNLIVGFVPDDVAPTVRQQLADAGEARLVTSGLALPEGREWRIWAGPPWLEGTRPPSYPASTIRPTPPAIFGIQLRTPDAPA
ncbi:hypothetical protein [Georgenia sp. H159]|uniref:hypothetical protein n=1 Tax=Georgenia sp. H159 TaxID=3076115 RepID=UPI002D79FBA9|nr:hypothetical protein [Georgenia sp. H159]